MTIGLPQSPLAAVTGLTLRCSACGAPFRGTSERETLSCSYCGTEQRLVDARQFLDHFTVQVQAFLRQSLPAGIDLATQGSIDAVARNAIFSSNVAPWLSVESTGLRFRFLQLISHPLLVLPFSSNGAARPQDPPATVALFGAKVQSITGLAVSEPSRRAVGDAGRIGTAYAAAIVAANLLHDSKPERFHLAAVNFATAAKELKALDKLDAVADRFDGLSEASRALDLVRGGEFKAAQEGLDHSLGTLVAAKAQLRGRMELAFTLGASDREISVARAASLLAQSGELARTAGHPKPITAVSEFNRSLDEAARAAVPVWGGAFFSEGTREELACRFLALQRAKNGEAAVRILRSGPGTLVPFWFVQLSYTFETGALWRKQARSVPDLLMVAATFPFEPQALSLQAPGVSISDIFRAGAGPGGFSGFVRQIGGNEQALSQSTPVRHAFESSTLSPVSGSPAVHPLAAGAQAVKLCETYLDRLRASNPKIADQLRSVALTALDIVYLPTDLRPGAVPLPWMGPLSPASVGRPDLLMPLVA